MDKVAQAA